MGQFQPLPTTSTVRPDSGAVHQASDVLHTAARDILRAAPTDSAADDPTSVFQSIRGVAGTHTDLPPGCATTPSTNPLAEEVSLSLKPWASITNY